MKRYNEYMGFGLSTLQIIYAACTLALFLTYGTLVRRGVLKRNAVLWAGIPVGLIAVALAVADLIPAYRAGMPAFFLLINAGMMVGLTCFCVFMSYRSQLVTDASEFLLGDTKFIVRLCGPARIPATDALILPTSTALRLTDGLAPILNTVIGAGVAAELRRSGPVGSGKVVATDSGNLDVGRIFHVAVSDPGRPVDAGRLQKGIEAATQQARKGHAESVAVPVGPLRGLTFKETTEATIAALLRQRRAFAEIVVVVFEARYATQASQIVGDAIKAEEANIARGRAKTP